MLSDFLDYGPRTIAILHVLVLRISSCNCAYYLDELCCAPYSPPPDKPGSRTFFCVTDLELQGITMMVEDTSFQDVAHDLGVPLEEFIRVAKAIGYENASPETIIDTGSAESLKATLYGMTIAAQMHHEVSQAAAVKQGESVAVAQDSQTRAIRGPESLILVNMTQQDIRVSENYEQGFNAMLRVIAALLADFRQTVRTVTKTVPWGEVYFLRVDKSSSVTGVIELEYGDTSEVAFSQRQKGLLGDVWWSVRWFTQSPIRPFAKLFMGLGVVRDPEADYRNQFHADLLSLEAQGLILGLEQWDIRTSRFGRNLILTPKQA